MNLSNWHARLLESIATLDTITLAAIVAFAVTEVLLLVIASFLTVKALLLRRNTPLGVALAKNNAAMALVYYTAFVGIWVPFVRHPYWSVILRAIVMFTALGAIRAFVAVYGGWRATGREIVRSVVELVRGAGDCLAGRCAHRRMLASTRRRHRARLNETRMLMKYSGRRKHPLPSGADLIYRIN